MANFSIATVTTAGVAAEATANANGWVLQLSSVKVGSGILPGGQDPAGLTGLINFIMLANLIGFNNTTPQQVTIRFDVSSVSAPSTFQLSEVGVYAKLNAGAEFLYCYAYAGTTGDTITPGSGGGTATVLATTTTAPHTVPAYGSTVVMTVDNAAGLIAGNTYFFGTYGSAIISTIAGLNITVGANVVDTMPPVTIVNAGTPIYASNPTLVGTSGIDDQYSIVIPYSNKPTVTAVLGLYPTVNLHAATHISGSTDPMPVASTAKTGLMAILTGVATDVWNGALGVLSINSPIWTPKPHKATHITGGTDQMTVATNASTGLMAILTNRIIDVWTGIGFANIFNSLAGSDPTTVLIGTSPASFAPVPIPAGVIWDYAGPNVPPGWMFCGGYAISRTAYQALFVAIGTRYGAGDGSTTFNIPNFVGRVALCEDGGGHYIGESGGESFHTLTSGEMPNHSHSAVARPHNHYLNQGLHNHIWNDSGHTHFYNTITTGAGTSSPGGTLNKYVAIQTSANLQICGYNSGAYSGDFNSATGYGDPPIDVGNAGSGAAHNNMMPYLSIVKMIKV